MSVRDDLSSVLTVPRIQYKEGWEPGVTETAFEATATSGVFESSERPDEETLIEGWGLDPAQWSIIDGSLTVNRWQGMTSAQWVDGQIVPNELVWLFQYKARLRRRIDADNLPLGLHVSPDFKVKVVGRRAQPAGDLPSDSWNVGLFYPDPQFGYWWDVDGTLRTIHDERCFDIRDQVLLELRNEYGKVAKVIGAGDTADLTHFSKYISSPNYVERTLQQTIDRTALEWQSLRAICPDDDEQIIVLDGNHDNPRLINTLIAKGLSSLVGIRQGGEDLAASPVLSIQHLTNMEKYGVQYSEPFPVAEVEFNSNLGCAHGPTYSSKKGGTPAAILQKTNRSMLHGHTHREELIAVTAKTPNGIRTYYVGSPGTFSRTDLAVPSVKSKPTSRGVHPVGATTEDWQQGFYVVLYDTAGSEDFEIEHVRIWNAEASEPSVAYWRGRRFESTVDADGNPLV